MPDPAEPAIQLYTVRSMLEDDLDGTLATVASIGFRQVEVFDLIRYRTGLANALPRHGLSAPSAHASLQAGDRDAAFDAANQLGVGLLIEPWTHPDRWQTADGVRRVADELNAAAAAAAALGLRVGYHNHHHELAARIDDRHALEVFADHLDPSVVLEIDAYWAYAGGADVPALLRRLGDRVVALHIKDGDGTTDPKRQVAAGDGVVPLGEVIAAAPNALRIVELDDTSGDLLDAVRASYAFVAELARV